MARPRINIVVPAVLVVLLLVAVSLFAAACRRDFTKDPVTWTFVGGEGSWSDSSRTWTVNLAPGESKSVTTRLDNTSDQDKLVLVILEGTSDLVGLHLNSGYRAMGDNGIGVRSKSTSEFTVTAVAYPDAHPGEHKYIVDMGYSTTEPWKRS